MAEHDKKSEKATYVSDTAFYHDNKRYGPGTPLPASVKDHPMVREATKAELKAIEEADEAASAPPPAPSPAENPDADEGVVA